MADEDGGRPMSRLAHGKIVQVIHWRGGLLALDDDGTSPSAPPALEADPVTPAVVMMSDRELERRLHEQAPLPKNPQDPIPTRSRPLHRPRRPWRLTR